MSYQKLVCAAATRAGARCRRWAEQDSDVCEAHRRHGYEAVPVEPPPTPKKRPPGYLLKFDAEAKERALELASAGMSLNGVATTLGVTRRTVVKHIANDPDFGAAWQDAYEGVTDDLEQRLVEMAKSGHYPALIAALKARRPEMYADKRDPQTVVAVGPGSQVAMLTSGGSIDERLQQQMAEFLSLGGSLAELGLPDPNVIDVEVLDD